MTKEHLVHCGSHVPPECYYHYFEESLYGLVCFYNKLHAN